MEMTLETLYRFSRPRVPTVRSICKSCFKSHEQMRVIGFSKTSDLVCTKVIRKVQNVKIEAVFSVVPCRDVFKDCRRFDAILEKSGLERNSLFENDTVSIRKNS